MFLKPEGEVITFWEGFQRDIDNILKKMIMDRKHFGFLVQMIDGSRPDAAGGYVEVGIWGV